MKDRQTPKPPMTPHVKNIGPNVVIHEVTSNEITSSTKPFFEMVKYEVRDNRITCKDDSSE